MDSGKGWSPVTDAAAWVVRGLAGVFAVLTVTAEPARAEMPIGVCGGWNGSFDSDVHLKQPNGTDLTLNDLV